MTGLISNLRDGLQRVSTRRQATRFASAAHQIHGPDRFLAHRDEPVVLITQWRVSDLDGFFEHYRRIGLHNFVFYSAHAPEDALARIKAEPNTIIVENGLRVAAPEDHVLAYLSEMYAKQRWCLLVRTDELLEFEGSDTFGIRGLTQYLSAQKATALMAHRLDMFPKGPLGALTGTDLTHKVAHCIYFDLSGLHKTPEGTPNQAVENGMFHTQYVDTKCEPASLFPLVFNGPATTMHPAPKISEGVQVANITAALKSYGSAAQLGQTAPDAHLFSLEARRWNRPALLVRAGFLQSAPSYAAWIEEHRV